MSIVFDFAEIKKHTKKDELGEFIKPITPVVLKCWKGCTGDDNCLQAKTCWCGESMTRGYHVNHIAKSIHEQNLGKWKD